MNEKENLNVDAVNVPQEESSVKNTEIVNTNTKNVNLGSTDLKKAQELAKSLDYKDMNSVVSFGTDVQKNISDFW